MWRCRYRVPWRSSRDLLVGLGLGRAAGRLGEGADDGPARQVDLEVVMAETLGLAEDDIRGPGEARLLGRPAAERGLGLGIAPRLVGDAAEGKAGLRDLVALELEADGDGDQSEGI